MVEGWALDILQKLQALDPLAHIAGGYLRDLDNGRPVKDLDIYLHISQYDNVAAVVQDTHPLFGGTVGEQYAIFDSNVASAISFKSEVGLPELNVIMLTKPLTCDENISRFDFGMCRIAFAGENIFRTAEYHHDRICEMFTLRRCVNKTTMLLSMARFKRLSEKYPEWRLVIPSHFSEFMPSPVVSDLFA